MILTNTLCLIIVGAIALFNGEMKLLKKTATSQSAISFQVDDVNTGIITRIKADLVTYIVPRG